MFADRCTFARASHPLFATPQIVAGIEYDGRKSDVWSLGVVLFALVTGELPFEHENNVELLRRVAVRAWKMLRGS